MSDEIGHHCGIALVRLKKPLAYYTEKYGSSLWGFNQLFLLMEKQHNRGQDGAGIGSMKLNMPAGEAFMFRERSTRVRHWLKYLVVSIRDFPSWSKRELHSQNSLIQ